MTATLVDERTALAIFGSPQFFSAEKVIPIWDNLINGTSDSGVSSPIEPTNAAIFYSEQALVEAAKSPNWHLSYIPGFSVEKMRILCEQNKYVRFSVHNNGWWQKLAWANTRGAPGYYLVNSKGIAGGTTWLNQEQLIKNTGNGTLFRAPLWLLVGFFTAFYFLKPNVRKGRQVHNYYYHWGSEESADGNKVYLEVSSRMSLGRLPHNCKMDHLAAYVVKKFDTMDT